MMIADTYKKQMAPPSPQLSQEDLVANLQVSNNKMITTDVLLSPVSPQTVDEELQSQTDVAMMMYLEFMDLIYWEIPGRSAIVLSGTLSSLVMTRYYSLLYVAAAAITLLTGFNLVFVNVYNFIRSTWTGVPSGEFPHPYHIHIHHDRMSLISRQQLNFYIHKSVDVLEWIAQATAKIVFVEDTKITTLACVVSFLVYLVTSLVPTKVFVAMNVLALFTIPYYYEEHQNKVDEMVGLVLEKSQLYADKASQCTAAMYDLLDRIKNNAIKS